MFLYIFYKKHIKWSEVAKMNVRKLIRFGKNSYVVSLPKQWVDKTKLKKGDLISIEENKEGLQLRINNAEIKKEEPRRAIINAENKSITQLNIEIVSAYLDNYHIIEVISDDLKTNAPKVRAMLRDLAGLEIINQTSTRIVAKDLINISEVSIKTLVRRMDNIARSMMEDTLECFDGVDHADSLIHIDEEVNRLHFLTYRVIRSGLKDVRVANTLGTNALKLHSDHTVVTKIERIADNVKRIGRYLNDTKLDKKWKKGLKDIFNEVKGSYIDVMKAYHTNDEKLALAIEESNQDRIVACDQFVDKHNHKDLKYNNGHKTGVCNFRPACRATLRIIENMKEMASGVKYIARTLIGGG